MTQLQLVTAGLQGPVSCPIPQRIVTHPVLRFWRRPAQRLPADSLSGGAWQLCQECDSVAEEWARGQQRLLSNGRGLPPRWFPALHVLGVASRGSTAGAPSAAPIPAWGSSGGERRGAQDGPGCQGAPELRMVSVTGTCPPAQAPRRPSGFQQWEAKRRNWCS